MKAAIIQQLELPEIPSASGIEMVGDHLFIVGDDAQHLFVMNKSFHLVEKIKLFDAVTENSGRISKLLKPDLESLTTIDYEGEKYVLTIGSGSLREVRDVAFLISLKDYHITKISLLHFYDYIRKLFDNLEAGRLNIEGALFHHQQLFLFHRGNISGRNILLSVSWSDFLHFEEKRSTASVSIQSYSLPTLNGLHAGFSGACIIPGSNHALFTASVENTSTAIDDGPSAGSYIGLLNVAKPSEVIRDITLLHINDVTYSGKVESVVVVHQPDEHTLHALAVCDEDGNTSQLLQLLISF